eukprot:1159764-Pelagomonas_calceolata.AAC.13
MDAMTRSVDNVLPMISPQAFCAFALGRSGRIIPCELGWPNPWNWLTLHVGDQSLETLNDHLPLQGFYIQ